MFALIPVGFPSGKNLLCKIAKGIDNKIKTIEEIHKELMEYLLNECK